MIKALHILVSTLGLAAMTAPQTVSAQQPSISISSSDAGRLSLSLQYEVDAAIYRALDWLAHQQAEDGTWSDQKMPALTALPLWAFCASEHPDRKAISDRAVKALLRNRQADGGIYTGAESGGVLPTYNTAVCMTALHALGQRDLLPVILRARQYVARAPLFGSDDYHGGFGYELSTGEAYANLLTTFHSVQAMRATADAEAQRPTERKVDIDWAQTVRLAELMTAAGTNHTAAAVSSAHAPSSDDLPAEKATPIRAYGSMTYAGLLALIYANVSPEDVRVRTALDWAAHHWSLEENPGMGQQGLYFFYNVLTRALDAAGEDFIPSADGSFIPWREAIAQKLVSLQKTDTRGNGYWRNTSARFLEGDPVLATAYCILALQRL